MEEFKPGIYRRPTNNNFVDILAFDVACRFGTESRYTRNKVVIYKALIHDRQLFVRPYDKFMAAVREGKGKQRLDLVTNLATYLRESAELIMPIFDKPLLVATHADTQNKVAVYRALFGNKDLIFQPLNEFFQQVDPHRPSP